MWQLIKQSYQQCYQQFLSEELYLTYLVYSSFPLRRLPDFGPGGVRGWIGEMSGIDLERFQHYIKSVLPEEIVLIEQQRIGILHKTHPRYPERLQQLNYPPQFLFYRGYPGDYLRSIAVVGTRRIDQYGIRLTRFLTREAVALGLNIISGAARGVDQIAQKEALQCGGRIVVVPGTGLGHHLRYGEHDQRITLITEFPLFFRGNKQSFPIRNRIIAGLSLGTIMVQAPKKSGALYTADYCLKGSKPLFVPPGDLFDPGFGGNVALLGRQNSNIYLITGGETLARVFNIEGEQRRITPVKAPAVPGGEAIIGVLENSYPDGIQFDRICHITGLSPGVVTSILLQLQLGGGVNQLPGGYYQMSGGG